ncbi:MFS transporter [Nocardia terpenica]|uniref:MFS transporter n=1 Tax=Nocardia terpenica TaxID=455432 RepID=A0A161WMS6_9NOCA|nr:MFS transporter [Nocardia terpenica]KZM74425.1 MFS transporter [Nocardia terpenica]NQE92971.1 MFS transporter [Nocardia terpenica]
MAIRDALVDVAPLRGSPQFRRLWAGAALSGLGSRMTLVAVMFQVWRSTHSTVWTGMVGVAQAVPIIAFGLFAGSMADRTDRRKFYLATTTGQTVCSLLLAAQGFLGQLPVTGVLLLVAVQSCFVAGGGPAFRAFIPHLLPRTQLAAGLALNRIAWQAAMLVGPALGGVVLGSLGIGGCYLIDAITFGSAFYGAFGLPSMPPEGGQARAGLGGVRDGLAFLIGNPAVRGVLLADLATTVLSMPISLFPLINAERFGDNPRTLGLFLSAVAVGGAIASVLSGTFTRLPRPGLVMLCGCAVWGGALGLFGLVGNPWLGLGFLVVAGAADTVAVVSRSTIVQLNTPNAMLGRLAAAEQIVGRAGPDIGNLRAGIVAGLTSGTTALLSGALLCLATIAAIATTTPQLRLTTHDIPPTTNDV